MMSGAKSGTKILIVFRHNTSQLTVYNLADGLFLILSILMTHCQFLSAGLTYLANWPNMNPCRIY
jgi:hypothetical protein